MDILISSFFTKTRFLYTLSSLLSAFIMPLEVSIVTKCYQALYRMPAADMGKENPLPDIKNVSYIHAIIETTDAVPAEDKRYINKGMLDTLLPYTRQDGYSRKRTPRDFHAVVLENDCLKAVFLPELGGRLWSLFDKTAGRELLYCNPVFQPGNLALRNAWFSGGVEFNVSIKGHNPLTCDPLFAQRITMPDGSQGLRMFEYERIRGVLYSIDAWLPENSRFLYIRPRIENRTGKEIWMYWWSNIAVPAYRKARVVAPTDKTFVNYFGNDHYILDYADYPHALGTDISYPDNMGRSLDFFYRIPDAEEKWITSVDASGYGLLQCSTEQLKGRKLFLWGQGGGGRNWNNYLSDGQNEGYLEIQAGLARTQLEHLPMADGDTWSWVEAYGAMDGGERMHGDIQTAIAAVQKYLAQSFSGGVSAALSKWLKAAPAAGEFFCRGSGWGALEELARRAQGRPSLSSEIHLPEDSVQAGQQEWITLYQTGRLPERDADAEPAGYVVDSFWRELLKKSLQEPGNQHWYAFMHLGVMEYAAGNLKAAQSAFERSAALTENAWSYRNLAMLHRNEYHDLEKAAEYMQKTFELNKTCRGILVDTAETYLQAGKNEEWLEAYALLGPLQADGRLKLYCAKALMALEKYREAAAYLNYDLEMPDIKEGDTAISDVWFALYSRLLSLETGITDPAALMQLTEEKYPLKHLDFRTH